MTHDEQKSMKKLIFEEGEIDKTARKQFMTTKDNCGRNMILCGWLKAALDKAVRDVVESKRANAQVDLPPVTMRGSASAGKPEEFGGWAAAGSQSVASEDSKGGELQVPRAVATAPDPTSCYNVHTASGAMSRSGMETGKVYLWHDAAIMPAIPSLEDHYQWESDMMVLVVTKDLSIMGS